jgi:SH3-like domain-containing protein
MQYRLLTLTLSALIVSTGMAFADAKAICSPARGTVFAVTGVAKNDTLNMRAGPTTEDRVVARLKSTDRNVRFDGEIAYASKGCRNACTALQAGIKAAAALVPGECTTRSTLWYKVRDANGTRGWAAARFLKPAAAVPVPKPEPAPPAVSEDSYNFRCDSGGRVLLIVRDRTRDAIFYDSRGQEWLLLRERGSDRPLSFRGTDENPDMYVRGDRREIEYSDARGRIDYCAGIRG